jgi:hypothetical protein
MILKALSNMKICTYPKWPHRKEYANLAYVCLHPLQHKASNAYSKATIQQNHNNFTPELM